MCLRNTVCVDFIGVRQPARARVWGENPAQRQNGRAPTAV